MRLSVALSLPASRGPIVLVAPLLVGLLLTLGVGDAFASRAPTRAESKAIKKAFFARHSKSTTAITRIRVSTVDRRFAAVTYTADIRALDRARAAIEYKPAPELLKKAASGRWKPVTLSRTPKKVRRDLQARTPRSDVRITGELDVTLTRAARCTAADGSASIYDPGSDIYLSIQFHQDAYKGPGFYPALGVHSVAGIYVNRATELRWQTGQSHDYFSPSGELYVDGGGWGIIEASMARVSDGTDTHHPQSVFLSGTWACG